MRYGLCCTVGGQARLVGRAALVVGLLFGSVGMSNASRFAEREARFRSPSNLSNLAAEIDARLVVDGLENPPVLIAIDDGQWVPIGAFLPDTFGTLFDTKVATKLTREAMIAAIARELSNYTTARSDQVALQLDAIARHWAVWSNPGRVVATLDPRLIIELGPHPLNLGAKLSGHLASHEFTLVNSLDFPEVTHPEESDAERAIRGVVSGRIERLARKVNRDHVPATIGGQVSAILEQRFFYTAGELSKIAAGIDSTLSVRESKRGGHTLLRTAGGKTRRLGPLHLRTQLRGQFTVHRATEAVSGSIRRIIR